jgi:hypothetical protein
MKKARRKYKCKHCGSVMWRVSDKQWIKSFCDKTCQDVRLTLIHKPRPIEPTERDQGCGGVEGVHAPDRERSLKTIAPSRPIDSARSLLTY